MNNSRALLSNRYFVHRYEKFKRMALARGDNKYAETCDKWIAKYKGGIERKA